MRRRSGAIHCDTEEQFIRLSLLSEKKLGIFYEETPSPSPKTPSPSPWLDFDYDKTKNFYDCQVEVEQIQTLNVMVLHEEGLGGLICESLSGICGEIYTPSREGTQERLELLIKSEDKVDRKLIIKFWISSDTISTILQSYCQRADVYVHFNQKTDGPQFRNNRQHLQTHKTNLSGKDQREKKGLLLEFFEQKLEDIRRLGDEIYARA